MNRRRFAAGAGLALLAAGCRKRGEHGAIAHLSAEELLERIHRNAGAGRATALHFWATWCGPCVEEFPLLEQEWRGWMAAESRLDFLAVSVDEPSPEVVKERGRLAAERARDEIVRHFARRQGASFPLAIAVAADPDAFAATIDDGWPAVLPATILFGLDGAIAQRNLGELRVGRFRDKVQELLR